MKNLRGYLRLLLETKLDTKCFHWHLMNLWRKSRREIISERLGNSEVLYIRSLLVRRKCGRVFGIVLYDYDQMGFLVKVDVYPRCMARAVLYCILWIILRLISSRWLTVILWKRVSSAEILLFGFISMQRGGERLITIIFYTYTMGHRGCALFLWSCIKYARFYYSSPIYWDKRKCKIFVMFNIVFFRKKNL